MGCELRGGCRLMMLSADLSILSYVWLTSSVAIKEETEFGACYNGEESFLLSHCPVVDREL